MQEHRLESTGICHYFDGIVISEGIGFDKHSPEFFNRCFQQMGQCIKGEMIILGGSPTSDILGGLQAGIHTCWFNPAGRSARADITPEYEIQKLQEFSLLLRRI